MKIHEIYPNAPKFEQVEWFDQFGTVRITDNWQDTILAACGNKWSAYDMYEEQFIVWLKGGELDSRVVEQKETEATQPEQPIIIPSDVFNAKAKLALQCEAVRFLIENCNLTSDSEFFYGTHHSIGDFKIQYAYFETRHLGGNSAFDVDGCTYTTDSYIEVVDTLTVLRLLPNGFNYHKDSPERPMGGGKSFFTNPLAVAAYEEDWSNWAKHILINNR